MEPKSRTFFIEQPNGNEWKWAKSRTHVRIHPLKIVTHNIFHHTCCLNRTLYHLISFSVNIYTNIPSTLWVQNL